MSDEFKIDPWGASNILEEEYDRLIKEFGIEETDEILRQKFHSNKFLRRKIIFGHRGLLDIYKAIETEKPWAVMSGIKPSGPFHLGKLTTALEIVEFQKMGGKAYYCIAGWGCMPHWAGKALNKKRRYAFFRKQYPSSFRKSFQKRNRALDYHSEP